MTCGPTSSPNTASSVASACPQHLATATAAPEFISLRTAVILLIAFVCGVVAGSLTFLAYGNVPAAVLAGLGAVAGALIAAHTLVR